MLSQACSSRPRRVALVALIVALISLVLVPEWIALSASLAKPFPGVSNSGKDDTKIVRLPGIPSSQLHSKVHVPLKATALPTASSSSAPPLKPLCAPTPGVGFDSHKDSAELIRARAASRDFSPVPHWGNISTDFAPLPTTPPVYCQLNSADLESMCTVPGGDVMTGDVQALVLTHKRVESLKRLFKSLNETAPTHTGKLHVRVCVDVPKRKTEPDAELMAYLETVQWDKGMLEIGVQAEHAALIGQWLGCSRGAGLWRHGSSPAERLPDVTGRSEVISIFEDDIEASPMWLEYVLRAHAAYKHDSHVVSYALQRYQYQSLNNSPVKGHLLLGNPMMLVRIQASWGFNGRMDMWNDFVDWYNHATGIKHSPRVPGTQFDIWYQRFLKRKTQNSMWTMWFMEYVTRYKLLTLYPNPGADLAFGLNWFEKGEHFGGQKVPKADSTPVTLLREEFITFPARPLLLDWSATPYNAPGAVWRPSPTVEEGAVRNMQCSLDRAARRGGGQVPLVAFVGGNTEPALQWLGATATNPQLQRRTVFVCEGGGSMKLLSSSPAAEAVGLMGHAFKHRALPYDRLGYLARVAAGGQPFAVFDLSAPWAGKVDEMFAGMGGQGGSPSNISVLPTASMKGAHIPYGFFVPSGDVAAVDCLWALHAAKRNLSPDTKHAACSIVPVAV